MRAIDAGHISIAQTLLSHGANVHLQDSNGWTALTFAVSRGHVGLMRQLIERGADLNTTHQDGSSPLTIAVTSESWEAAMELIGRGVDFTRWDSSGQYPSETRRSVVMQMGYKALKDRMQTFLLGTRSKTSSPVNMLPHDILILISEMVCSP
eukprot:c18779_g1_i3.p1 GENE.c18779_g1_i3~~c18779_g1_i3.p1  ORF type:complete len:152 (-),score=23.72 c18779_g1_i3:85-540(-)